MMPDRHQEFPHQRSGYHRRLTRCVRSTILHGQYLTVEQIVRQKSRVQDMTKNIEEPVTLIGKCRSSRIGRHTRLVCTKCRVMPVRLLG